MPRVLPNWIEAYLAYIAENEAPEIFHLFAGISCISSTLRRRTWFDMGYFTIYPNTYIALVGPAGRVKKTTAIKIGQGILKASVADIKTSADSTSREKLIDVMARSYVDGQSAITATASEFGTMLTTSGIDNAIAGNTAARVLAFNGLRAEPLYHPPRLAERITAGPSGDYILSVGRLESIKRHDLAIRAMALRPGPSRLVIAGTGTQEANLHRLVEELDVGDQVHFAGEVADEELLALYAGALGVVYAPFDEDYGYVTLEAFLAHKPVVTARDSGGTLEFVQDGVNGHVCDPSPDAVADVFSRLAATGRGRQPSARRLSNGRAGSPGTG